MNPGGTGTKHLETYFINSIQVVPNKTLVCLWRLINYSGMETPKLGKVYHSVHGVCMSVVRSNSCLLCNPIIRILQTLAPAEIRRQSHAGSGGKQQRMLLSCCSIFCPTPAWFISIYPQLNWNYKWSQWIYLILQYRSLTLTLPSF